MSEVSQPLESEGVEGIEIRVFNSAAGFLIQI